MTSWDHWSKELMVNEDPIRRRCCSILGVWSLLPQLGWVLSAQAAGHKLLVTGTGSAVGGMRAVSLAYLRQVGPETVIDVLPAIGSRGSMRAMADGKIDMALTNFEPQPQHVNGIAVQTVEYARTPFVLAVKQGMGLGPLTAAQVAQWYEPAARLPNGQRARPVLRPGDDVDNLLLAQISPLIGKALQAAGNRPGMLKAGTDSDAADLIEQVPGAFGATTLAQIVSENRNLEPLAIDGRLPSLEGLRDGSYLIYKRLIAVVRQDAPPQTRKLLEFLRTPQGHAALLESGQLPT